MDFNARFLPGHFRDLDQLAAELKERSQSSAVARKWFLTVVDAIDSLAQMPQRCPVVMEAQDEIECVRLLLHGKRNRRYRIYYCVRKLSRSGGTVSVFHVRHWARKGLREDELQELMDEGD